MRSLPASYATQAAPLTGRPAKVVRVGGEDQWNESPQAQEFCAFGLSIVKP